MGIQIGMFAGGESKGQFCDGCTNRGNCKGPLKPKDLVVERFGDDVSLQFIQPPGKRGRHSRYSLDQGAPCDTQAGENLAALSPKQVRLVGKAVMGEMGEGCADGCAFGPDKVDEFVLRALEQHDAVDEAAEF